ncbi:MAG: cation diffusion facilitator family transporter [Acidimicrobiia bacterium]|nr:cation diffusion facilitator family transporter [Acidimicrobiia bacterium]MDH3397411.1 cation diffusion facilitator family transporter [Acidimicrobiia bacterium]
MAAEGSKSAVLAALVGNSLIAVAKFVAAFLTSSAAMLAEAFHSVADSGNQVLLLRGISVSRTAPTVRHPFGRGKEVYFWSLLVAVMLFVAGGVLAVQRGIEALQHPHEISTFAPNYIVLGVAFVIEGFSFRVAFKHFNVVRGSRGIWRSIRETKDSALLVVLLEDSAAMLGLVFAIIGLAIAQATGNDLWDGVASIAIGILLGFVAMLLATETKQLLVGEAAGRRDRAALRMSVLSLPEVESVGRLLTMHMGPEEILVNLEVDLTDGLTSNEVERVIDTIETEIRKVLPGAMNIFVELQTRADG